MGLALVENDHITGRYRVANGPFYEVPIGAFRISSLAAVNEIAIENGWTVVPLTTNRTIVHDTIGNITRSYTVIDTSLPIDHQDVPADTPQSFNIRGGMVRSCKLHPTFDQAKVHADHIGWEVVPNKLTPRKK